MTRKTRLWLAGAISALTVAVAVAATVLKPGRPTIVCLLASSGTTSCQPTASAGTGAGTGGTVKWHPGHYARVGAVSFTTPDAERFAAYDRIRTEPLFKGISVGITWGSLEPRRGVYDFSAIDNELAFMRSMGKQMIIEIWATNYWHEMPTSPQRGNRYVPDYLIDENLVVPVREGGYSAAWANPRVMDYFLPLARALCERYDQEPLVEQIAFGETAIDGAYEYVRLIPVVGEACRNTAPILHMNYVNTPELARELVALAAEHGVGIGGPDILPPRPISPYGEDHGSLVLRGAGYTEQGGYWGEFGSTDYRGVIPVSYQFQAIHNITPPQLIDYALDTLRVTHLTWSMIDHLGPEMNWSTGVLPLVRAQTRGVSTACPSTFQGGCQTQ